MAIKPKSKPQQSLEKTLEIIKARKVTDKVVLVCKRGYYLDTMGKPGVNDRRIYDDAMFLVVNGGEQFASFNANLDPNGYRKGRGEGSKKGMARIKAGVWRCWKIGNHKKIYPALRQCAPITVIRDGIEGDYEDHGMPMTNIHPGGVNSTSSLGCLTLPPDQWPAFIAMVQLAMKKQGQPILTVILVD